MRKQPSDGWQRTSLVLGSSTPSGRGGRQRREARLEVLPAEDGARPYRTVPTLGEGSPLRPVPVVPVALANERPPLHGVSGMEGAAEDSAGGGAEGDQEVESRWKIRYLLSDGRCGQAVLGFLSSTDVGRLVPPLEEGDAGSQASE